MKLLLSQNNVLQTDVYSTRIKEKKCVRYSHFTACLLKWSTCKTCGFNYPYKITRRSVHQVYLMSPQVRDFPPGLVPQRLLSHPKNCNNSLTSSTWSLRNWTLSGLHVYWKWHWVMRNQHLLLKYLQDQQRYFTCRRIKLVTVIKTVYT